MTERNIYADNYSCSFSDPSEFLDFLKERQDNSRWMGTPSRSIVFESLEKDTPMGDLYLKLYEHEGRAEIIADTMENTNLLGFHSDGTPRTSKTELETTLQVSNEGSVFYIGGLEKSDLVRSVNKVPFLGDLPGLGWIFSGESEIVKKSRIVAVLTIQPVIPTTRVTGEQTKFMKDTRERIDNFGLKSIDENEYGFDQLLVDPERR